MPTFTSPFTIHAMKPLLLLFYIITWVVVRAEDINDGQGCGTDREDKAECRKIEMCFALPYGLLGFISHLLTFYTIGCLFLQRRPFMPWRKLSFSVLDLFLYFASFIATVIITAITMARCSGNFTFVAFSVLQLFLSVTQVTDGVYSARNVRNGSENGDAVISSPCIWPCVYFIGFVFGMDGLFQFIDVVFFGYAGMAAFYTVVATAVMLRISGWKKSDYPDIPWKKVIFRTALLTVGPVASVLGHFWVDWAIAIWKRNWVGIPTSDNQALYWSFWVAERIPMFSS